MGTLRSQSLATLSVAALIAACGGQVPTPNADLVADTTVGRNRCQAGKDNDRPFVVEWDATDIASFEAKAKRDLVFVKIDGCTMKLLDCRDDGIPGKYGSYDATQWTTGAVEGFEIKNEGDLYAKLPFGATSLSGSLKGGNELQLKYYVSGSRPSLRSLVYRNDVAANPLCASATHFVAGYDLGAFDLSTKGNLGASAKVDAPAANGGGNYAHSESHLRSAGSLDDCKKETAQDVARCRVPIRLSLRAVAEGSNPGGPTLSTGNGTGAGPFGMTEDQLALIASAQRKMALKDGPGCLADMDRLEASGLKVEKFNMDSVRANCEMLVGRCDDGRRRYRAWLERVSPQLTPDQLDSSAAMTSTNYCQGVQRTPVERVESAKQDVIDARHKLDRPRCTEDAKIFLEQCPKIPPSEKNGCDAAQYAAECIAKVEGGDCTLARKTYELYVNRVHASQKADSRELMVKLFKCPALDNAPPVDMSSKPLDKPATDKPPAKKKKPKKP